MEEKYAVEHDKKMHERVKRKSLEEWNEIMKNIGLSIQEYEKKTNTKNLVKSKLVEAIEHLNRLLNDKNLQIEILEKENCDLNAKNFNLNKENIFLFQQNIALKKNLEKYLNKSQNSLLANKNSANIEDNNDSSFVKKNNLF